MSDLTQPLSRDPKTNERIQQVMQCATGGISALQECGNEIATLRAELLQKDAVLVAKNTALLAAADALDTSGWALESPPTPPERDALARSMHNARDAARKAAEEGV